MTKQQLKKETEGLRTWIEVDTKAFEHNYAVFRNLIPKTCNLMAVAKSNAYGHDFVQYTKFMEKTGVDWIGVDSITEALALRREGVLRPILVLGYTLPARFYEAARNRISISISSFENIALWRVQSVRPKIHLKIDTGMHRQGFLVEEIPRVIQVLKNKENFSTSSKNIYLISCVEGVYTHFAAAKNPAFPQETKKQVVEFEVATELLQKAGLQFMRHAAATGGALVFPETQYDMVRIGIGLYGHWPSRETEAAFSDTIKLKPALSWKTIIGEIKKLLVGAKVGYDLTEKLPRPSRVAILPVGYWHGYPRVLSSIGHILVNGRRSKVLGRVSMDMLVIDVTGILDVHTGDTVTLIGHDGTEKITAEALADLTGTTSYEMLTRLNPLMKRIYV